MVKKFISLIIMITITMMMTSHVFAQDTVFIDDNFEASSTENWIDNTGRGIKSVEGDIWNKYMVLTHKDSSFYNFQARDIYSTGVLYCEFDIKFTSAAMQIQTRESRDISAQGFTMAGRLRKTADYRHGRHNRSLPPPAGWPGRCRRDCPAPSRDWRRRPRPA